LIPLRRRRLAAQKKAPLTPTGPSEEESCFTYPRQRAPGRTVPTIAAARLDLLWQLFPMETIAAAPRSVVNKYALYFKAVGGQHFIFKTKWYYETGNANMAVESTADSYI
jgi:hypothetical protein